MKKKYYVVGYTFGQCHEKGDRCFSFVVSKISLQDAIQKAVDLTVDQSPYINGPQIEYLTLPDEDAMADFWYGIHEYKSIRYHGIDPSGLL